MGLVICKEHGPSGGPMTCDHLRASVEVGAALPPLCAVTLTFDFSCEDFVGSIVCETCAKDWDLSDGGTHPYPNAEGDFPRVVPTCMECYRAACARAGVWDKLTQVRTDPGEDVSIEDLRAAVERAFSGSRASFVEGVEVRDVREGQTVWEGTVKLFDLEPSSPLALRVHRAAQQRGEVPYTRVYAWSYPCSGESRRFMTLLGKIQDPAAVVREHGTFLAVWRKAP